MVVHRAGLRRAPRRKAGKQASSSDPTRCASATLRLLRRPLRRRCGEMLDRRPAGRADRRLPGRADHAHPRPRPAEGPGGGYARTFLRQLEDSLGHGRRTRRARSSPTPAGSTRPGWPAAIRELADRLGLAVRVAHVEGDDLLPRAGELGLRRARSPPTPTSAAGASPSACAPARDVVVTGRVTDASLVVGPAAAHFGWARTDFDELAGATVAGHVIECGAAGDRRQLRLLHRDRRPDRTPGFPIAEIAADGSAVITKHAGHRRRGDGRRRSPRNCSTRSARPTTSVRT